MVRAQNREISVRGAALFILYWLSYITNLKFTMLLLVVVEVVLIKLQYLPKFSNENNRKSIQSASKLLRYAQNKMLSRFKLQLGLRSRLIQAQNGKLERDPKDR